MDADGSIVYRWNHTFRIQIETDKTYTPVYADTRIPYTGFLCVCVYAHNVCVSMPPADYLDSGPSRNSNYIATHE